MLAGGISNFWQLCHFLTGNFWKMSDYGNSHNLEDVWLWKKCQIMGISIIWKIVKYLSMTRVALLSIFPVFYIISNLCLYIKMYKYSLKKVLTFYQYSCIIIYVRWLKRKRHKSSSFEKSSSFQKPPEKKVLTLHFKSVIIKE